MGFALKQSQIISQLVLIIEFQLDYDFNYLQKDSKDSKGCYVF